MTNDIVLAALFVRDTLLDGPILLEELRKRAKAKKIKWNAVMAVTRSMDIVVSFPRRKD